MINCSKSLVKSRGFTIVELLVVIIVIGILASIGIISYSGYQKTVTVAQLKSDLNGAATAMEDARNFGNSYPVSLPSTFEPDQTISLSGGSNDGGKTYCIDSSSSKDLSLQYYIDSVSVLQGAQLGTCADSHPAPDNLAAVTASNTSMNVSWDAVTGATSYTLQRDISSSFAGPTIVTQSGTTTTASGLTQGINYYYRISVTTPTMTSGWSATVSANTNIAAPTIPTVAVTPSGGNVLATVTPASTCTDSTAQYEFRSRANDGVWSSYSAWNLSSTSSQTATQGYKYDYQAIARCYVNDNLFGSTSTGAEISYIYPITTVPTTPTVATSVPNWSTTTYSWGVTSCAAGSSVSYQYRYTISPSGYDSGWVAIAGTSVDRTTSSSGYTYTVQVQTQCYSPYSTGPWSASGSASYYRPYTVTTLIVAGGGNGGSSTSDASGGGGGGGGVSYHSAKTVSNTSYTITVGVGGASNSASGGNSSFTDITSYGGGGGGPTNSGGYNGGCGGGGAGAQSGSENSRGYSTQVSTGGATPYGNYGGKGQWRADGKSGGGGGGAGGIGGSGYDGASEGPGKMNGGAGLYNTITGAGVYYAGGGGGASCCYSGIGGTGGGGNGAQNGTGANGAANTGGGGGGGGGTGGGHGGSGVVVISYSNATMNADGGSKYTSGSNYVHVFTSSGTFTVY